MLFVLIFVPTIFVDVTFVEYKLPELTLVVAIIEFKLILFVLIFVPTIFVDVTFVEYKLPELTLVVAVNVLTLSVPVDTFVNTTFCIVPLVLNKLPVLIATAFPVPIIFTLPCDVIVIVVVYVFVNIAPPSVVFAAWNVMGKLLLDAIDGGLPDFLINTKIPVPAESIFITPLSFNLILLVVIFVWIIFGIVAVVLNILLELIKPVTNNAALVIPTLEFILPVDIFVSTKILPFPDDVIEAGSCPT